jgi:gentisate 1,2-dioxygenase
MESVGIPVHRGYFIEDLRKVELGWWAERGCHAAFLQLAGMEGVCEARVTEVPPGKSLPPVRLAIDEVVYVLQGRGLTTVWRGAQGPKKTFEWQTRSLFMVPRGHWHQFSNTQGERPVRLLHCNYLPIAMSAVQDSAFFLQNPYEPPEVLSSGEGEFYAEAKAVRGQIGTESVGARAFWYGNFFPDLKAWDQLVPFWGRGAGGRVVFIQFPGSECTAHMSVFPARTYKKAHRHGPGFFIVIPAGEGYSLLWPEGKEKVVVPWHEASAFVPPDRWFHQHFNLGSAPARYLALHPLSQFSGWGERVEDRARDQFEYADEDPWVRRKFEEELGKRGLTSLMPPEAYKVRGYEWDYGKEG